jgi:hypothetical protein
MQWAMHSNRFVIVAAATFALAACATTTTSTPVSAGGAVSVPSAATTTATSPLRTSALQALAAPGTPGAATLAEVVRLLGAPDVERRDGAGALLTWRLDSCALVLGFAADRLSSVSPGPRRIGEAAPALETCIAEAQARIPTS